MAVAFVRCVLKVPADKLIVSATVVELETVPGKGRKLAVSWGVRGACLPAEFNAACLRVERAVVKELRAALKARVSLGTAVHEEEVREIPGRCTWVIDHVDQCVVGADEV